MNARTIITLSERLIENQIQIKQLQQENTHLKGIILKHTVVGQVIESDDGEIECRQHNNPKSLISRNNVLNYIFEKHGKAISQDVDKHCTRIIASKKTIYIKLRKPS
jgi:hypothetical protein